MNEEIFKDDFKKIRGAIQQRWGDITDQDIEELKGQKDKLVGLIQEKYGEKKENIEEFLNKIVGQSGASMQDVLEPIFQTKGQVVDYTQRATQYLQREIKENPLSSLFIGIAVGFIIGKLSK